jgi:O-antigen/teichoic acid export membrane protein
MTSALTVGSLVFSLRLIAQGLGSSEFGAFCLARQMLSAAMPFCTMGLGIALVRYLPMAKNEGESSDLLLASVLIVSLLIAAMAVVSVGMRVLLTAWIFREPSYVPLFLGAAGLLGVLSYHTVVYAYYRGSNQMGKANSWQLLVIAIGPVVIALTFSRYGKADVIVLMMAAISSVVLAPLARLCIKAGFATNGYRGMVKASKELAAYGLPRIPGSLAYGSMLAAGPLLAPHFGTLEEAGYLVVGQSLFRIIEGGIEAFGIVALPRVAAMVAGEQRRFLAHRISDVLVMIIHLGVFMTPRLFLWSAGIVSVWIGYGYIDSVPIIRILSLALIPYLAFSMLRSFIDGLQKRAVATVHLFLSLMVTIASSLVMAGIGLGARGLAAGTGLGMMLLGGLTVRYLWKAGWIQFKGILVKEVFLLNFALFAVSVLLRVLSGDRLDAPEMIGLVVLTEGALFSLYLLALWRRRVSWITELVTRVVPPSNARAMEGDP